MRTMSPLGGLLMICLASAAVASAVATTAAQPTERLVKDVPLQPFFHSSHAWQLKVYQVVDPVIGWDGGVSVPPIRVCFVQPPIPKEASTICAPLSVEGWSYQKLDSVRLRMLPGSDGKVDRPSLVIRATARTGRAGEDQLHGVFVWTHFAGAFGLTFDSAVGTSGEQEFVEKGPLSGAFVTVNQVSEGDEPTKVAPRHYQMTVYEPVSFGYIKVLSILSEKRYPSDELGDGIQGVSAIMLLTPNTVRALKAVYPDGVYTSAVQR